MLAYLSRRELQRRPAKLPLTQAASPFRLYTQVLGVLILGQVVHRFVNLAANVCIIPVDPPNTKLLSIALLVSITAEVIALPTGNVFPQLTYLTGLVNITADLRPVEEECRVNVVAPILPLLNATDMPKQMIKDLVTLDLPNQPIQIRKYILHTLPILKDRRVMKVQPNHD